MNQTRNRQNVQYSQQSKQLLRDIPRDAISLTSNAEQYISLCKLEAKLDATVARKKYDMQDSLTRPTKLRKTLRVWISNTVSDQAWQDSSIETFDFENISVPTWTLKIEGLLIDHHPGKFTDLIRSIVIEDSDGLIHEYQKTSKTPSLVGIQITRKGDSNVSLKISILLDHSPEKYGLPDGLCKIVGSREASRQMIVSQCWRYITLFKLLDSEDTRLVHCDALIKSIFNVDRIFLPHLPKLIDKVIQPPSGHIIDFEVSMEGGKKEIYDFEVEVLDPFNETIVTTLSKFKAMPETTKLESEISETIAKISTSLERRAFFKDFSEDPVRFMDVWMASQTQDGSILLGDVVRVNGDQARRAEFYKNSPWIQESIFQYLSQRIT